MDGYTRYRPLCDDGKAPYWCFRNADLERQSRDPNFRAPCFLIKNTKRDQLEQAEKRKRLEDEEFSYRLTRMLDEELRPSTGPPPSKIHISDATWSQTRNVKPEFAAATQESANLTVASLPREVQNERYWRSTPPVQDRPPNSATSSRTLQQPGQEMFCAGHGQTQAHSGSSIPASTPHGQPAARPSQYQPSALLQECYRYLQHSGTAQQNVQEQSSTPAQVHTTAQNTWQGSNRGQQQGLPGGAMPIDDLQQEEPMTADDIIMRDWLRKSSSSAQRHSMPMVTAQPAAARPALSQTQQQQAISTQSDSKIQQPRWMPRSAPCRTPEQYQQLQWKQSPLQTQNIQVGQRTSTHTPVAAATSIPSPWPQRQQSQTLQCPGSMVSGGQAHSSPEYNTPSHQIDSQIPASPASSQSLPFPGRATIFAPQQQTPLDQQIHTRPSAVESLGQFGGLPQHRDATPSTPKQLPSVHQQMSIPLGVAASLEQIQGSPLYRTATPSTPQQQPSVHQQGPIPPKGVASGERIRGSPQHLNAAPANLSAVSPRPNTPQMPPVTPQQKRISPTQILAMQNSIHRSPSQQFVPRTSMSGSPQQHLTRHTDLTRSPLQYSSPQMRPAPTMMQKPQMSPQQRQTLEACSIPRSHVSPGPSMTGLPSQHSSSQMRPVSTMMQKPQMPPQQSQTMEARSMTQPHFSPGASRIEASQQLPASKVVSPLGSQSALPASKAASPLRHTPTAPATSSVPSPTPSFPRNPYVPQQQVFERPGLTVVSPSFKYGQRLSLDAPLAVVSDSSPAQPSKSPASVTPVLNKDENSRQQRIAASPNASSQNVSSEADNHSGHTSISRGGTQTRISCAHSAPIPSLAYERARYIVSQLPDLREKIEQATQEDGKRLFGEYCSLNPELVSDIAQSFRPAAVQQPTQQQTPYHSDVTASLPGKLPSIIEQGVPVSQQANIPPLGAHGLGISHQSKDGGFSTESSSARTTMHDQSNGAKSYAASYANGNSSDSARSTPTASTRASTPITTRTASYKGTKAGAYPVPEHIKRIAAVILSLDKNKAGTPARKGLQNNDECQAGYFAKSGYLRATGLGREFMEYYGHPELFSMADWAQVGMEPGLTGTATGYKKRRHNIQEASEAPT